MKVRTLERQILVEEPLSQVFQFFSQATNLQILTPQSLRFEILSPLPIIMKSGVRIEYRLRLFGVPFRWEAEITSWEPEERFVDVQRRGPYLLWEHEHRFRGTSEGTFIEDRLRYAVPGGPFEGLISWMFVSRQVTKIFDYRERAIRSFFTVKS
ncbi:MAG: SRPBCC family protein [Armatimonadetes bacterium]|uniref:CDP-paratose 2-epimerase n=1 Tax=Candidatus Nitrosymbiomonas proteolyticus TaxID=2608984 RepID=A0A809S4Y1_9BACT|nr:MAG: CDP-paratose 2-epimerase [Armatimonadota bacterium]MBL1151855.1 CDP-paratose 2-epimerase [Armatimonadota bacterium]NOG38514.1 SRPBCC family protein [Armatimonadota bacterium]BBO23897.1 CDP-paratose 2-epimerase [Candidatus Nitrosymbiomonas proteolyticus]GIK32129.1 MAG: hypothetical protein BroJett009_11210 [Armatimonadota bacterium]